jgi:diketogulonate reductase-like aldo/keto reductase
MQAAKTSHVRSVAVPLIMYGTAWKEDRTQALVLEAIATGFRAFDTANQRKHYVEEEVGAAVRAAIASGTVTREDLFLQTKFTYQHGQDYRLPYDPDCDLTTQVRQSIASSLEHLGVTRIDSYILHGPSRSSRLRKKWHFGARYGVYCALGDEMWGDVRCAVGISGARRCSAM